MTQEKRGTIFVVCASLLYSLGGLCMKFIPWSGLSINGARTGIALFVIGGYLLLTRHRLRLNRWIALGALSVFSCNALFSVANKLTTAANAIILQFTMPVFVILFSWIFFRRKAEKLDIAASALVLGGLVFFFLDSLEMGGGLGNLLALISGISYSGIMLMNEMPDSDSICSVFWGDMLSAVVGIPFILQEAPLDRQAMISLVILGVFQVGAAYVFLCEGIKHTPPIRAGLIAGIEPILNPTLVAVFYGERVGVMAMIGAAIVILTIVSYNVLKSKANTDVRVTEAS